MTLSDEVQKTAQEVAATPFSLLPNKLNTAIGRFVGWPYIAATESIIDSNGNKSGIFASVILTGDRASKDLYEPILADNVAAVIDVNEILGLGGATGSLPTDCCRQEVEEGRVTKHRGTED
jgi:hypothetical protein